MFIFSAFQENCNFRGKAIYQRDMENLVFSSLILLVQIVKLTFQMVGFILTYFTHCLILTETDNKCLTDYHNTSMLSGIQFISPSLIYCQSFYIHGYHFLWFRGKAQVCGFLICDFDDLGIQF